MENEEYFYEDDVEKVKEINPLVCMIKAKGILCKIGNHWSFETANSKANLKLK